MRKLELTNDAGDKKVVCEHVVEECLKVGWVLVVEDEAELESLTEETKPKAKKKDK